MKKRVLAFLLVMAMVFSLLPVALVGAETESTAPAYTVIMQKAHNQTEGSLAIDIYLQATVASEITGYQFTVNPADGITWTGVEDQTGNDNIAASEVVVYDPAGLKPITLGTSRKLVATITVTGETLPAQAADAISLTDVTVTTADASYTVTDIVGKTVNDAWADVEGTWLPLDQATFDTLSNKPADANYYLIEDITATAQTVCSNVNLDLNGYTWAASGNVNLLKANDSKTLTINDCTATGSALDGTLEAGTLVAGNHSYGGGLYAGRAAVLTVSNVNLDASAVVGTDSGYVLYSLAANTSLASGRLVANNVYIYGGAASDESVNSVTMADARGEMVLTDVRFSGFDLTPNDDPDTHKNALMSCRHQSNVGDLIIENVVADGCNNYSLYVENTNKNTFKSLVIKGDTKLTDPVYIANVGTKVTLDLTENAQVNILTPSEVTAEEFANYVEITEGATLPDGVLVYENLGCYVTYENGVFSFGDSHKHDANDYHDNVTFKVWNDASALPVEGDYYLTCDVTIDQEYTVPYGGILNLDLNGHTITQTRTNTRVYYINGELNIYDCAEQYDADGNWTGGVITGGNGQNGVCLRVGRSVAGSLEDADRPTLNMYGGRLAGNGDADYAVSGTVYITASKNAAEGAEDERGGLFNMYGGEIYDNHTKTLGGAVTVWGLSSTRAGTNKDGERSAVAEGLGAEFNMYGGKIHGNSSATGGAVHVYRDAFMNVYGGEFSDNTSAGRGGAIDADSEAALYIEKASFYNNTANRGGAVCVDGTLTVKNSVFDGNAAQETDDVATNHYGSGGAIYLDDVTTEAQITDSVFNGNSAYRKQKGSYVNSSGDTVEGSDYAALGGAIYAYASKVRVERCELTGNSTNNHGGAIVTRADGGYFYMKDTTITGNTASKVGGAMYTLGSNVNTFDNCTVTGNTTGGDTGAVYVTSVATRLVLAGGTVIAGNTNSTTASGGNNRQDVFFQSQASRTMMLEVNELSEGAHVNMFHYNADCVVNVNDTADGFVKIANVDGAAQTDWSCGWITVYTGTADTGRNVSYMDTDGNSTKEFVFGHFHTDAEGNLIEYTATATLPTADEIAAAQTASTEAGGDGVARFYLTDDVSISAQYDLPGSLHLCMNGKVVTSSAKVVVIGDETYTFTMDDCTATYGADDAYLAGGLTTTATNQDYGALVRINAGHFVLNGGKLFGVTRIRTASGGAVALYVNNAASTVVMNGGEICDNHLIGNFAGSTSGATMTPAIQLNKDGATLDINGGAIRNNTITMNGGAYISADSGSTLTVTQRQVYGSSIYIGGNNCNVTIDNCRIEGNTISGDSAKAFGGIYGGQPVITNTVFKGNRNEITKTTYTATTAVDATSGELLTKTVGVGYGGAMYRAGGTHTISGCEFIDNYASDQGGAIYIDTTSAVVNITDSAENETVFKGNESGAYGGAIFVQRGTLNVTGVDFTENYAADRGGAIMAYGRTGSTNGLAALSLKGCTFTENSAKNYSGALYIAYLSTLNADGCSFIGNTSARAGVFYCANSTTVAEFDGCEFVGNSATSSGATIFAEFYSTLSVTGCTFKDNVSAGVGGAIRILGNSSAVATIGGAGDAGNVFTGNVSHGGTVYLNANGATVNFEGCTFTENVSTGPVSALRIEGTTNVTVKDTTIQNNTSASHGALFVATAACTLKLEGKVIVTDNISNDRANDRADLFFQERTDNNAFVNASGLTEGSLIGVDTYDDRAAADPVFTTGGSAAVKDYFFLNDESRFILHTETVDGAEELSLVKYVDEDGVGYGSVQDAITAAEAAGETSFTLQKSTGKELTLTTINYIDLNGSYATGEVTVADGVTLTIVDTATDDYDCSDSSGRIKITGDYNAYVEDTTSGSLKRYVVLADENGYLSAHRIYLAITAKTLRPTNNGVGFKAIFAGDEVVAENIVYGVQLSGYADFSEVLAASFDTMEPGALTSTPNQKTVVIYDAITAEDTSRWSADLYGRPFITIGDQTIYGTAVTVNMKTMAANALNSGDETVIAAVNEMLTNCGVSVN